MNIRDLEYFYHLYRLHSFTAVSKHCRVSQPTVSYAIKRLEDHFACHLFVKDPSHRNVAFTHQGDIVAKHAEAILTELSVLSKEIHRSIHAKAKIEFPPIIRARVLAQLLEKNQDLSILSEMEFSTEGSLELLQQLISGDLDFSLVASLHPLEHPKLTTHELYKSPFYILVSESHKFADKEVICFKDDLEERFILLNEGHVHMEAFNILNEGYQNQAVSFLELSDLPTIGQLVEKNLGISLITDVTQFESMDKLVKIPLEDDEQLDFHVSYAYLKGTPLSNEVETFKTLLDKIT